MTVNSMEFCTKTSEALDKAIAAGASVGFFEDNVLKAKFVGAKTVLIPEMDMSGLGTYDRENGFVTGSISVTNEPYVLTQDRARSFMLDREDEDESGIAGLAGEVLGEFVRMKVIPEVDAYCLSKLADVAVGEAQTISGDPETEAYSMLLDAMGAVQEEVGFDEELVCFVDGTFLRAVETSPEMERHLHVTSFKKGGVDLQVKELNGMKLLPVPASRMKTAYTFYNGGEGQEEGGFTPDDAAKSIGFLLLPKRACSLVKKSEKLRTFAPDNNPKADAWKLDYRLYYDVFIKNSMKHAVYAYLY